MLKRKVLLGTVLLLTFGLVVAAAGCSWFTLDKDGQKDAITKASDAFKATDSYKIEGTIKDKKSETEFDMMVTKQGDDMELNIGGKSATLKMLSKEGYVYIGNSKEWLRYEDKTNETVSGFSESFNADEVVKNFKTDYIDNDKIVYDSIEKVDGDACYKFNYSDIGEGDNDTGILWITKKDNKIKKVITNNDNQEGTMLFTYDDVSVEIPADYTEVDAQKDYNKIFEVMGEFMQANPDFGS